MVGRGEEAVVAVAAVVALAVVSGAGEDQGASATIAGVIVVDEALETGVMARTVTKSVW